MRLDRWTWTILILVALCLPVSAKTQKTYHNGYCCSPNDWSDCYPNSTTPQECSDAGSPPGSLECPHSPTICTGATASNSNATVAGGGSTYPPPFDACHAGYWAGGINTIERSVNSAKHYTVSNGLNEWVVSSPPGMVPVRAQVKFYVFAVKDGDGRALVADWHTYSPACQATDYSATPIDTALVPVPLASLKQGWHTVELRNVAANMPANGRIGLRFHIDGDADGDAVSDHWTIPTGVNLVAMTNGRGSGLGPSLTVFYAPASALPSTTEGDEVSVRLLGLRGLQAGAEIQCQCTGGGDR